jgi:hypothetical protein
MNCHSHMCSRYSQFSSSKEPFLVGGFNPSEQYDFVSWDDDIPNIYGKYFKCSKPPTRLWFIGDYIHTYNQVYKPPTRFYHRLNQLLHRRFPSTRWLPHRWLPPAAQAARQRVAARLRAGAAPPGRCGAFVGAQPGEAGKIPAVGPKNGGSTIENHGKTC